MSRKTSDSHSQRIIKRLRENQKAVRAEHDEFIKQIDEHYRIFGNYGIPEDDLKEIEEGFIKRYKQFDQDIRNIEAYDRSKRISDIL